MCQDMPALCCGAEGDIFKVNETGLMLSLSLKQTKQADKRIAPFCSQSTARFEQPQRLNTVGTVKQ
ncbi:hypothetical protein AMATHDRAFT_54370 [Amanita thiersii Skay4041]|uniref:Uncharacterized protein n=1 Tax=Amanita thiersii Skay4041 TaxID=703135 RepID=A0A2A9NS65_9AGAR|nr:hypothetical protein AMATHDRAFT_54370 [Amanita thiersii Skay4041]